MPIVYIYIYVNIYIYIYIPGPPKSAEVSAFLEKGAFLLLAAFLVSLAAFFFQCQVLCKTGSRKSAEFGGKSAEFGGKSAEFGGSRFQHAGVFVAFRRFFSRAAFCGLFGGNFCRRGLSAEGSAAEGSRYVRGM